MAAAIPLQAGHDPGEEVGPEAAVREGLQPADELVLPERGVGQRGTLACSGAAAHPWRHGSKRAQAIRVPTVVPAFEQLGQPRGVAAADHPRLEASRASSSVGRCSSTPAGRSAASSATVSARSARRARGHSAIQAVDLLDEHEAAGAGRPGDPRGDRVGRHRPRRGQRVERGSAAGSSTVVRPVRRVPRSAQRTAPGISSLSSQPNCSMPRIAMRCEVVGAQREAAVGVAHGVGEPAAAGHDEQRVALARARRAPCTAPAARRRPPRAPSPPPTLTTVSTGAPPASAGERRGGRHVALRRAPRQLGDRPPEARGDLARRGTRPSRPATTGASAASARCTRRAAASIWRTCSPCR